MSQEIVEALKRGVDAMNRRDVDALLEEFGPAVELHGALQETLEARRWSIGEAIAGHSFRVTARYDNSRPYADVMGIVLAYVWWGTQ